MFIGEFLEFIQNDFNYLEFYNESSCIDGTSRKEFIKGKEKILVELTFAAGALVKADTVISNT